MGVADPGRASSFAALTHVDEDLRRVTGAFVLLGYTPVELGAATEGGDLSRKDFQDRLGAWLDQAVLGPDNTLALYFTGHGYGSNLQHYLCFRGFDLNAPSRLGLSARELAAQLLDRTQGIPGRLWILLDCCMAAKPAEALAHAMSEMSIKVGPDFGAHITSATGASSPAFDGAFSSAFEAAVIAGARTARRIEGAMRAAWSPQNPQLVFFRNIAAWDEAEEADAPAVAAKGPFLGSPGDAGRSARPTERHRGSAFRLAVVMLGLIGTAAIGLRLGPCGPARHKLAAQVESVRIAGGVITMGLTPREARSSFDACVDSHSKEGCGTWEESAFAQSLRTPGTSARPVGTFGLDRNEVRAEDFATWLNASRLWHFDANYVDPAHADPQHRGALLDDAGHKWVSFADGPFRYTTGIILTSEGKADLPATGMSHAAAARYCADHRQRLPTEEEWELAARGPEGRTYPWGNEAPTVCGRVVFGRAKGGACAAHGSAPQPVHAQREDTTPEGVRDLGGNVAEWTATVYAARLKEQQDPSVALSHVLRGGSFMQPPVYLQSGLRFRGRDTGTSPAVGFRCAND